MEEAKRAAEAAQAATPTTTGATPDYAAGLTALNPATPQPIYTPTTARELQPYSHYKIFCFKLIINIYFLAYFWKSLKLYFLYCMLKHGVHILISQGKIFGQ